MGAAFLARASEEQEFGEHWVARRVVPSFGSRWPVRGRPAPEDLEQIAEAMSSRALAEVATVNLIGVGIAVEQRDGISWSAEKVRRLVETRFPTDQWEIRAVAARGSPEDELDEIGSLLGSKRAVRDAARESRFVPELRVNFAWWLGVRGLYAVGAVAPVLIAQVAADVGAGLAAAAGLAGVTAVFSGLRLAGSDQRITIGPSREADEKVEGALKEGKPSAIEDRFVDALTAELVAERPRVVIIDDYATFGARTRAAIANYLEGAVPRRSPELWFMFERAKRASAGAKTRGREPFSAVLLGTVSPGRNVTLWRGRQMPLTRVDRETLIWKRERRQPSSSDPRLRRHTVAEVADKLGWDEAELQNDLLKELDPQPIPVRRVFALLALAAVGPGTVDRNSLAASVSASTGRWASTKGELLRKWLPDDLHSQAAVEQTLQTVTDRLGAMLEDLPAGAPRGGIRVTQPHSDAIRGRKTWEALEFPDQDLGHAFWALDSRAKLGDKRHPLAGDRLVAHLRALESPRNVRAEYGDPVAEALFDVAIDGIEVALALAMGGIAREPDVPERPAWDTAPGLLMQARLLLDAGSRQADPDRCASLLTSAWATFMLTDEPAIRETLENLTTELGGEGASQPDGPLLRLYRQMQPRASDQPLWPTGDAHADAIVDHARARAGLLATAVQPMLWDPSGSDVLADAAVEFSQEAAGIAERAGQRIAAKPPSAFSAVDYLTLSTLTLADTLVRWRDGPGDSRVAAHLRLAAKEVPDWSERRPLAGTALHSVDHGLARQFEATHRGATILLARDEKRELESTLSRLDELQVMWHNLEYSSLADHAAVARNVLQVVAGRSGRDARERRRSGDYLLGVSAGNGAATHRATLEFIVSAARDGGRREVNPRAALPLVEGACTVLDAHLGKELTLAACRAAIRLPAREEQAKMQRLLRYLLDPANGGSEIFKVPEDQVHARALEVLSCCANLEAAREIGLHDAILRRREEMESPWAIDRLDQMIDVFEDTHRQERDPNEIRERASAWRARIWSQGPPVAESASPPHDYLYYSHDQFAFYLAEVWPEDDAADLIADAARLIDEGTSRATRNYVLLAFRILVRLDQIAKSRELTTEVPADADDRERAVVSTNGPASMSFGGSSTSPTQRLYSETDVRQIALSLLRRDVDKHTHTYNPLTAYGMYSELVYHFADDRAKNRDRAEYYRAQEESLWEERLLLEHQQGHIFEIFWHHYRRLPEIPLDVPREEVDRLLEQDTATYLETVTESPEPLVFGSDGRPETLAGAFVCVGHHLLHGGPEGPARLPRWDDIREEINRFAEEQLRSFYWLLTERTPVSPYLVEVLRQQRERFDEQQE